MKNKINIHKWLSEILLSLSLFTMGPTLFAQNAPTQLEFDIAYLSSDYLEGRMSGSEGERKAAAYIASRFEALGLKPLDESGWFQSFSFKQAGPHGTANGEELHAKNVVGYIDNQKTQTVVIGAHYDHLGWGGSGSLHAGENAIHNGADDNASGVAVLLELASQLINSTEVADNNYVFIAFSGEEQGLFGSKYFVDNPLVPLKEINFMINMDMVGRLNQEKVLVINGVGTSPAWKETIARITDTDLQIKTTDSGLGPSDHSSFYLKDIPAIHFFTGQHKDYHKPADDSHLVNIRGCEEIANYIYSMLFLLNERKEKIAFTKTVDKQTRVSSFKVTLGVMPDYVFDGKGLRIDAVLDGRPAQLAGMQDGDILIKLGDYDIEDVYAYMKALGKYEKGARVKAVVLREDKEVDVTVTF